jgi:hypothetical protein
MSFAATLGLVALVQIGMPRLFASPDNSATARVALWGGREIMTLALASESVRRLQAGLHSFLSMRRIEARRKNASAFRLRFSQSLASLRQRLSQAMVRSTIQRFGKTTNPLT